jgi:hypothetical protein
MHHVVGRAVEGSRSCGTSWPMTIAADSRCPPILRLSALCAQHGRFSAVRKQAEMKRFRISWACCILTLATQLRAEEGRQGQRADGAVLDPERAPVL